MEITITKRYGKYYWQTPEGKTVCLETSGEGKYFVQIMEPFGYGYTYPNTALVDAIDYSKALYCWLSGKFELMERDRAVKVLKTNHDSPYFSGISDEMVFDRKVVSKGIRGVLA